MRTVHIPSSDILRSLIIIMSRLHNAEQSGWDHDFNQGNSLIRNHTPDFNQGAVLILIMLRDLIRFSA